MDALRFTSIKIRLTILVSVIFAITASLILLTEHKLSVIKENITVNTDTAVAGKVLTLSIKADMNYVSRLSRSIMLGDDYDKNMQKLHSHLGKIAKHFQGLARTADATKDPAQKERIRSALADAERDTRAFLDDGKNLMLQLGKVERTAEVRAQTWQTYRTRATPLANKARASFGRLIELTDQGMKQGDAGLHDTVDSITTAMYVAMGGFLLFILVTAWLFKASIVNPLTQLQYRIECIEQNADLTERINSDANDEIGALSRAFDRMLDRFQRSIGQVSEAASAIMSESRQMQAITESTHEAVAQQQSATDQVATAIRQLSHSAEEVAGSANNAAEQTSNADTQAESSKKVVSDTVSVINQLAEDVEQISTVIGKLDSDSENIGGVLDVIRGIAEQTNLLALNAAIEAARAGEQGRGFAVVADEVRTLASRTQQSTEEIQNMIECLQNGARDAVKAMEQGRAKAHEGVSQAALAGESLDLITSAVGSISSVNMHISQAAREQTTVAADIAQNIMGMTRIADQSAESAEKTTLSSQHLTAIAGQLRDQVEQFKI